LLVGHEDDLKNNELADDNSYSSQDIGTTSRNKYRRQAKQIIKLVIDMLQRDVEFFSSKVIGDRFDNARLLIAARRKRPKKA
jgi:hypothetical protein